MSEHEIVYVATYCNGDDTTTRVFEHEGDAYGWRREIAANGWAELYGNEPEPDDVAAEYFDRQEVYREFFDVTQCEIEPGTPLAPEHEPFPAKAGGGVSFFTDRNTAVVPRKL
jgi:hypothetical protein